MDAVDRARRYLDACRVVVERDLCLTAMDCGLCHQDFLDIEAAALAYDLAVSEASRERARRRAVAWA